MSKSYVPSVNSAIISIAAWNKTVRRHGINPRTNEEFNDPHLNIKLQVNTVKMAKIVADALSKGEVSVEILGGMWANEATSANDPSLTGNADVTRADIEQRKIAAAQAEAAQALNAAQSLEQPAAASA